VITHLLNRDDGSAMAGAVGPAPDAPQIVAVGHAGSGTIALYVAPEGGQGRLVAVLTHADARALSSILDGLTEGRW
jgi:hypothetical protein